MTRWVHEAVLEAVEARLDRVPEMMRLRPRTAAHPFAMLKAWTGSTHFLTETPPRVRTAMCLRVLAWNLKRGMNILGVGTLLAAVRA